MRSRSLKKKIDEKRRPWRPRIGLKRKLRDVEISELQVIWRKRRTMKLSK